MKDTTSFRHSGHSIVIGPFWGDEGKGKFVDKLAQKHDIVVRYQGGGNAGHTVVVNGQENILHMIPSGIIHGKVNVIGNGCVPNGDRLAEEVEELTQRGIVVTPENLYISERAHIVTPYSLLLDVAEELVRKRDEGKKAEIGTTMQGIGPTYTFKAARIGIRFIDLLEMDKSALEKRIHLFARKAEGAILSAEITPEYVDKIINGDSPEQQKARHMIRGMMPYWNPQGKTFLDEAKVLESMLAHRERFAPFVKDTSYFLAEQVEKGKRLMFEGAQGSLLDLDHGTYPHVTSSNPTIGGAYTGSGIYVDIEHRIGVFKAYTTRVGGGVFPTLLDDDVGKGLQERGAEKGATTGRKRDCGWLDGFAGKYAIRLNGINEIALTKLDILDSEPKIKICVAYELDGKTINSFPATEQTLARVKPLYETLPGWQKDTSHAREFEELPANARNFVTFLENYFKTHVKYISIGKERDQVITRWK